jgi:hypothetical protein
MSNLINTWLPVLLMAVLLYLIYRLEKRIERMIDLDTPLRQVFFASVDLQNEFFSQALKLSEDEIRNLRDRLMAVRIELQIWKSHYAAKIGFFGRRKEGTFAYELAKREEVLEAPSWSQFPLCLAKCPLLDLTLETNKTKAFDFGPNVPEKLEVLLTHKALILRPRDGRLGYGRSEWSSRNDPRPTDLVIPIREADLEEYEDRNSDADWMLTVGRDRFYRRSGRWMNWTAWSVSPKSLFGWLGTTSSMDASPVKLNDGGKSALQGSLDDRHEGN